MFLRLFLSTVCCLFLLCADASALQPHILVIQGLGIGPYNEALTGFRSVLDIRSRGANYAICQGSEAGSYVRERRPDLILAIGADALRYGKRFRQIPLVHVMVLNPQAILSDEKNVTGVGMTVPPERQLAAIRKVLPEARRIGLLYDPKKSAPFLKRTLTAARSLRFEIHAREVYHPREVSEQLIAMKGSVDALWLIPDTTVITPDTIESIMLFSLSNAVPVCAFSAKYVEVGALMSVEVSPFEMGRQAGELAARILSGTPVRELPPVEPERPQVTISDTVARKLRLKISDDVRSRARIVR